jgi:hypothetical protein
METIVGLVVIAFIAVIGTVLYLRSKNKVVKTGSNLGSNTSNSPGKGDLKNPK